MARSGRRFSLRGRGLLRTIRSSLSVRSAVLITASGLLLSLIFGTIVSIQLTNLVFQSRKDAILEDASLRFSEANTIFSQSTAQSQEQVQELARQAVQTIHTSAGGAGASSVVLLRSQSATPGFRIAEIVDRDIEGVLTEDIRRSLAASGQAQWQSVEVTTGDSNGNTAPGIIVGTQVTLPRAGVHELYIVYSLANDQATINMVMWVLAVTALPILLTLPFSVYLMMHHVLRPVRTTAAAASRLSDGDLGARVDVHGNDEMSHLANAFNDMASSLQKQITEYDELSTFQQRFVSDVSHELRTPLTTIRMAEEMIWEERQSLPPHAKRSAELLHEQVARFESMLADLLEISRYDAQSALLDPENLDLRIVVAKVVKANADLAGRLNVAVDIRSPESPCTAEIDARRIERVLRNLLVNAIEHADGTNVIIDIAATSTDVAIRVRDHGVGMTPEVASRVFDRFYRADPARTRTTGGTGLGLSIASEDVALHHGTLEAWGQPGQGASFLMTLPSKVGRELVSRPLQLWEDKE